MEILEALKQTSLKNKEYVDDNLLIERDEDVSYEHKNLLSGYDKIISVTSDGSMDNNLIVSEEKSLIPDTFVYLGKTLQCPLEINGVHLEKIGNVYHIYGTYRGSSTLSLPFGNQDNEGFIPIDGLQAGDYLTQICITDKLDNTNYNFGLDSRYFNASKSIIMPNKFTQMGRWNKYIESDFIVPEGAVYLYNILQIYANVELDFYFCIGLFDKTKITKYTIPNNNLVVNIGDKTNINTIPYKTSLSYKLPIKEYVDNFAASNNQFEVTPEQFGAIGDGETDDTDSIINAIAFAEQNNYPFVMNKKYKVTSTIKTSLDKFYCNGSLYYYGNNYCINFDDLSNADIKINEIKSNNGGILITATNRYSSYNRFDIGSITAQDTAISFETKGKSIEYIDVYLHGRIWGGNIALNMIPQSNTWVAEIRFYGGQIITKGGYEIYANGTAGAGAIGTGEVEGINFYGTAIDAELYTGTLPLGIYMNYCRFWNFFGSRMESSPISTPVIINNNCTQLYFHGWKHIVDDINLENAEWNYSDGTMYEDFDPEIVFYYCCLPGSWINIGSGRVKKDKKIYWNRVAEDVTTYCGDSTVTQDNPFIISDQLKRFPTTFKYDSNKYVVMSYNYNFWGIKEYYICTNGLTSESSPMVFLNEDRTVKHRFVEPNKKYKVSYYAKDEYVITEMLPHEITLSSPNGTKYKLSINDDGIIKTTLVEEV